MSTDCGQESSEFEKVEHGQTGLDSAPSEARLAKHKLAAAGAYVQSRITVEASSAPYRSFGLAGFRVGLGRIERGLAWPHSAAVQAE